MGKCGWRKGLMDEIISRKGLPADTAMNGYEIFELVNNQDPEANAALTVFFLGDFSWSGRGSVEGRPVISI